MKFKSLLIVICGAFILLGMNSCTQAKAGNLRSDFENWIGNLLTPKKSVLEKAETGYLLKTNLKNRPNNLVILWEMRDELYFMDSARTDASGNLEFKGNIKEPVFCMIQWNEKSNIYLFLDNKTNAVLEINPDDASYSIQGKGIEGTMDLKDLISLNNNFSVQFTNLENQINRMPNTPEAQAQSAKIQAEYHALVDKRNADILKFALDKKKSYLPYFIIRFAVMENPGLPLLEHALKQCLAVSPTSKYSVDMQKRFDQESKLAIGAIAPDFEMAQPNGEILTLKSLRGKYVLIDFWASWCGPCRKENPFNTKMYKKWKDKGFEILGVSLDDDKNRWKNAIATDSLAWKHVSELKGWEGKVNRMYQISGIPNTVLLDKQGHILAKGLRGELLEAKLREVLANP